MRKPEYQHLKQQFSSFKADSLQPQLNALGEQECKNTIYSKGCTWDFRLVL